MDLYYLAAGVTTAQAVFGFLLMPLMALPAFGGIPMSQVGDCMHPPCQTQGPRAATCQLAYVPAVACLGLCLWWCRFLCSCTRAGSVPGASTRSRETTAGAHPPLC